MRKPLKNLHWTAQITLVFLLKHLISGVVGAFVFGTLLLYFDVSKLWTLISGTSDGWLVVIMLYTRLCITFGSIAMGWGIFSLAQERDEPVDKTYY